MILNAVSCRLEHETPGDNRELIANGHHGRAWNLTTWQLISRLRARQNTRIATGTIHSNPQ